MTAPYYADDLVTLYLGDALDVLRAQPSASADLIATDPPYFGAKDDDWDNAWPTPEAFLAWLGAVVAECRRVLRASGSLYWFASPEMAGRVEVEVRRHLRVLNVITWAKPAFSTKAEMFEKGAMRAYFPASERIIFAEQPNAAGDILRVARVASGLTARDLCAGVGAHGAVNNGGAVSNWESGLNTPSREQYKRAAALCALPPYEATVRPFAARADAPYTDVWTFATVGAYPGKHPCEKPLPMMEHIVRTSSPEGGTVLDPFCGSGTTAEAARNLGRRAVVGDLSAHWCRYTAERLSQGVLSLGSGDRVPTSAAAARAAGRVRA